MKSFMPQYNCVLDIQEEPLLITGTHVKGTLRYEVSTVNYYLAVVCNDQHYTEADRLSDNPLEQALARIDSVLGNFLNNS